MSEMGKFLKQYFDLVSEFITTEKFWNTKFTKSKIFSTLFGQFSQKNLELSF